MAFGYKYIGIELEQSFLDAGQGCACTGITKADWVRFAGRWTRGRYLQGRYWCPQCLAQAGQITGTRAVQKRTWRTQPRTGQSVRRQTRPFTPLPFPDRRDGACRPQHGAPLTLFATPTASYARSSGRIPTTAAHHYSGNIETWAQQGYTGATLLQGDSRQLQAILQAHPEACVSSPPFCDSDGRKGGSDLYRQCREQTGRNPASPSSQAMTSPTPYGDSPHNLGNLRRGSVDATIASPPFSGTEQPCASQSRGLKDYHAFTRGQGTKRDATHTGTTEGQLSAMPTGDLVVSSPPYATGCTHTGGADPHPEHVQGGAVHHVAYGASDGQLGNMVPGEIGLVSPQNPDRMQCSEHNTLSGDSLWQSVKTAAQPYHVDPAGASHAVNPTLALPSKDAPNIQDMGPRSLLPDSIRPCPTAGESRIHTGAAAITAGEDMLGASSDVQRSNETDINVADVAVPTSSKSTTKKIKKTQGASGTMPCPTSKHSASPAMGKNPNDTKCEKKFVVSVEQSFSPQPPELPCVPKTADANRTAEPVRNSTEHTLEPISANSVASPLAAQDDTSSAQSNACKPKKNSSSLSISADGKQENSPSTFWEAVRDVVSQTFAVLKPNGKAVWVVKDYVRDGQIVPFSQQWRALCEHVGFVTLHEHHALLYEEHGTQGDLFGGEVQQRTKRVSFFRRLHEKKRPDLAINFEVVLCMVKPGVEAQSLPRSRLVVLAFARRDDGHGGGCNCASASPPYAGAGEVLGAHNGIDWSKAESPTGKRLTPGRGMYPYGSNPKNLGNMPAGSVVDCCVASPPYVQSVHDGNGIDQAKLTGNMPGKHTQAKAEGYGRSSGQLGAMPPGPTP